MMKVVVITGSTRGIGLGLADSFLALGCAVAVSGRGQDGVAQAIQGLSAKYGPERVFGQTCDVTRLEQVQALWDSSIARFRKIDIWINNAGISNPPANFWELPPERIHAVVETNLVGAMHGCKVALQGMLAQGFGFIYNMEGYGSHGRNVMKGMALYGSTKAALRFLTDQLAREVEGTSVRVGALRPGMVITDMLTGQFEGRQADWQRARRIFNILAERVETVTPWLARRILENERNGARIAYVTGRKILWRFLTAPFSKRELFPS